MFRFCNAEHTAVRLDRSDGTFVQGPWPATDGNWAIDCAVLVEEFGEPSPFAVPTVDLVAHAADVRWRKEVGGVSVSGIPIATDDRAKLMITGARVAAMADPGWTTSWHGTDGNTYPVNATAMVAISDAVQAHVNATFATFAAVKAAIEAGAITTAAQVDAAFDPPA